MLRFFIPQKADYFQILLIVFAAMSFSGCIKENLTDCPVETGVKVIVKAFDTHGNDITKSGVIKKAEVYVFDKNNKFMSQISVDSVDIQKYTPVKISETEIEAKVVIWSNLSNKENITIIPRGFDLSQAVVMLKNKADGYAFNPDDMFYGLIGTTTDKNSYDLPITRKTARFQITVKGLDPQYNDYYFVISGAEENAFRFNGDLTGFRIEYKQQGLFTISNGVHYFVTPEAFTVLPLLEGRYCTISIYRGNTLIASTHINNENNSNIVPIEGITTNLFLNLVSDNGQPSLISKIEVTDWDEITHIIEW